MKKLRLIVMFFVILPLLTSCAHEPTTGGGMAGFFKGFAKGYNQTMQHQNRDTSFCTTQNVGQFQYLNCE